MVRHRTLLILILVWSLAMIVPDRVRLVRPLGSFGFSANSDGLIQDVTAPFADEASSPAFKAGIREGQRLDLAQMIADESWPRKAIAAHPLYADARWYGEHAVPIVMYGAGPPTIAESNAKRPDENLLLEDLRRATKVMAATVAELLGHNS